jgi:thiol-disulfide isomerase/thioredoxin
VSGTPPPGARRRVLVAAFAGVAVMAGIAAGWLYWRGPAPAAPENDAVRELRESPLAGIDGAPISIDAWRGKVVLVNFWATWCVPCKEEIPLLAQAQKDLGPRGLQVVGVALDSADKVREYLPHSPINYAVAITGMEALGLIRDLGDDAAALPFSVVLDRSGQLVVHKLGPFHRDELQAALQRALR